MNRVSKGNYYKTKTARWYRQQGYDVASIEIVRRIVTKDNKVVFSKKDLWGGDLCASNKTEMIWIQVKSNKAHISAGIKELIKAPLPPCIRKVVVYWPLRAREPEINEVEHEPEAPNVL